MDNNNSNNSNLYESQTMRAALLEMGIIMDDLEMERLKELYRAFLEIDIEGYLYSSTEPSFYDYDNDNGEIIYDDH